LADDTILLWDASKSQTIHAWSFDQDGRVPSPLNQDSALVVFPAGGNKSGELGYANVCASNHLNICFRLFDCNTVIPAGTHIVRGTEQGTYSSVWVRSGGQYTDMGGDAVSIYVESGGSLILGNHIAEEAAYYLQRGASLQGNAYQPWVIEDSGYSSGAPSDALRIFHCPHLQFVPAAGLEVPTDVHERPIQWIQTTSTLTAQAEGEELVMRIFTILGEELLHQRDLSSVEIDLSMLAAGVYFAVIDANGTHEIRKVVIAR
jgi:hypothetical protein